MSVVVIDSDGNLSWIEVPTLEEIQAQLDVLPPAPKGSSEHHNGCFCAQCVAESKAFWGDEYDPGDDEMPPGL